LWGIPLKNHFNLFDQWGGGGGRLDRDSDGWREGGRGGWVGREEGREG